jgi:DNA repair exonuclease SbcCD nuclease subunit
LDKLGEKFVVAHNRSYVWQPASLASGRVRYYQMGYAMHQVLQMTRSDAVVERYRMRRGPTERTLSAFLVSRYLGACQRNTQENPVFTSALRRRILHHDRSNGFNDAAHGRPRHAPSPTPPAIQASNCMLSCPYLDPALEFATLGMKISRLCQPIGCHVTPMKFIHTADIHLDQSCSAMELLPLLGNEYRAHLHAVLQRILNRARDIQADAVFITGDLFEHERVTRNTVNALREAFGALAPTPVFLCAGRHDPAVPGSPYLTEAWTANVHLFTEPVWRRVDLPGLPLTVHGFGLNSCSPVDHLPDGLEVPQDGRIHIAIGHGLEQTVLHGGREGTATFESTHTLPGGVAYLGLGGLHAHTEISGLIGTAVWYPGSPESCYPGASGSHACLEIDLESGSVATVTPVVLSSGRFQALTLDCSRFTSGQELLDGVRALILPLRDCPLIRITLEGSLLRQIYDELDGIRDILGEEVHFLQWREACQVGEDYETIAGERTSLGAFVQRISEEISDAPNHGLRLQRLRSRDLGVCAYRATPLPIRGLTGDYR